METINYKGHLIVKRQTSYPLSPNDFFEDGFVLSMYRNFNVTRGKIKAEYVRDNYDNYNEDYYIYDLSLYEHSGIALHIGNNSGWDTSNVGYIMIDKEKIKSEDIAYKKAEELIKLWNIYLMGDIYDIVCESCEYEVINIFSDENANDEIEILKTYIDDNYKDSTDIIDNKMLIDLATLLSKNIAYYKDINKILSSNNSLLILKIKGEE